MSGVLCNRQNERENQGEGERDSDKTLVYGADELVLKKAQTHTLEVAEMRKSRWMCGFTKLDKIKIWETTKVGEMSKKV